MTRVKRGATAHKRRGYVLRETKGFRWGRKSKYRLAKDALHHAWEYATRDRKTKKRAFRVQWQTQINAAAREEGVAYGRLIHQLKEHGILLDRKILSQIAVHYPKTFKQIVEASK